VTTLDKYHYNYESAHFIDMSSSLIEFFIIPSAIFILLSIVFYVWAKKRKNTKLSNAKIIFLMFTSIICSMLIGGYTYFKVANSQTKAIQPIVFIEKTE